METLRFLQKILPDLGIYVLAVKNLEGGMHHRYYTSIDSLSNDAQDQSREGYDVYYAISAFSNEQRLKENVRATKVLTLDVDCADDKPYPSWREGLRAVSEYIDNAGLPKPLIVCSGRGLHVYWILDRELSQAEWQPLAEALKKSVIHNGLQADAGLIANGALILRPIGTHNNKNGKKVTLLVDRDPISVDVIKAALLVDDTYVPFITSKNSPLLKDLSTTTERVPANPLIVSDRCHQIKWAIEHQDKVSEPLWYSIIGVAAYCSNPENTAKEWSKNYPNYTEASTIAKLGQWKKSATGPATCAKFQTDRPRGCSKCPLQGKITSPAQIGTKYVEIGVSPELSSAVSQVVQMPKPYKRTLSGIKITIDDTDIDICEFDIHPVSYGLDESLGYEVVRYVWNRPHVGETNLVFRQAYLADGSREFPATIADQGIVLKNIVQTRYFHQMLRDYMHELRKIRNLTNLYSTMGWKDNNNSFVLGDFILRNTKGVIVEEQVKLSGSAQRQSNEYYSPKGDLAGWTKFTSILDICNLWPHMFALGVGFSAPLYRFTGLKGITVSLHGPTGGGKSLAQQWIQSIYGDPDKLHFAAKYTQNSLFARLGLYANLPMTIDEVTMMDDRDVSDFCYWVTQGRDKARLNRNSEENEAKTWETPVIVSTNTSLQSKLIASKHDTDAQMARLLEVMVPVSTAFSKNSRVGLKIYQGIHGCYGHAGKVFIGNLLKIGQEGIEEEIKESNATFNTRYKSKFTGQERYWEQAIVLTDLASRWAQEWGLINYDYTKGIEWVLLQLGAIRRSIKENEADAYDLIGEYMTEFASTILVVEHTIGGMSYTNPYRLPRADVRVRIDLSRKTDNSRFDRGTMMIDRRHFRCWLSARGSDYKAFRSTIEDDGADATPRSKKFSMGKDTIIKLAQSYVIGFNLSSPRLSQLLDPSPDNVEDQIYGDFKAVK